MKLLKEWIDERINDEDIDYFDYNEFSKFKERDGKVYGTLKEAYWENRGITVILKSSNHPEITESDFKDFIAKLKINHSNISRSFGLAKDSDGNYFSILEYASGGNLRKYLKEKFDKLQWKDKIQMGLDISRGLMYLHSINMIHGNLHSYNVLFCNGRLILAGFGLFEAAKLSEKMVYVEPQRLRNPSYKLDMKSDIYSLGVLLWELTSGSFPFSEHVQAAVDFAQILIEIVEKRVREKLVEGTPLEYIKLYERCWDDDPNLRPEIDEVYKILMKKSSVTQLKLNHGLIVSKHNHIMQSIRAAVVEDGELLKIPIKEQPSVYTDINNSSDVCINFLFYEITYNGNLLEPFLECTSEELHESYGHLLARKFKVGGRLFIKGIDSATSTQIDMIKFYLICAYDSAKYSSEIPFDNLFAFDLLPKIETLDGKNLNTYEKLVEWMSNLYQEKGLFVIFYDDLISTSQLRHGTSSKDCPEPFNVGVANSKEELGLEEWVGGTIQNNLISWASDFHLFRGLTINENFEIEISKEIAIEFIEVPKVDDSDKYYAKMIEPLTSLEVLLISNDIIKNIDKIRTYPFIIIKSNDKSYKDYYHILVKRERYEILLSRNCIKPTKEFEQTIEKALNSMKPLKALQDTFNKYGHLFPRRIILGRSLKNILTSSSSSGTFDYLNLKSQSLNPYLKNLNVSYLLTREGKVVEKDGSDWIQNKNDNLEIVELDDVIPLYKILKVEQQREIDDMLKDDFRIIMTGVTDLKDLDNDVEHYKRINVEPSLGNEDYEVFGSIISKDNSKLEEFYVSFGLYSFNEFFAMIKKPKESSINITECYVLWVIIGNPSKSSVFSPNNREFQVKHFKKSITLQPNQSDYLIETPFPILQEETILINAYFSSTNYEHNNIKLIEWKDESIKVKIAHNTKPLRSNSLNKIYNNDQHDRGNNTSTRIKADLRICVLSTSYKGLKIDKEKGGESSLDLIGYVSDESITPDKKAEELIKNLTETKSLYALKSLFENPFNQFSPQVLQDSLVALANPKCVVARLELHLRTLAAVLEQICFTQMHLNKELQDKVYSSLKEFAEIQEGTDQLQNNKDENMIEERNYNVDFLLIHLRDTLYSLRDGETWFQESLQRTKDSLKDILNTTPEILSNEATDVTDDASVLSVFNQLRQNLNFEYPVASSYYVDWRIMLIIHRNLSTWPVNKKFRELALMEFIWSFSKREWDNRLDFQPSEVASNKFNIKNYLSDLDGNEHLALPHILWFGILDLAQDIIQKSIQTATYCLCYHFAIKSLNKSPNNLIQFKAIEILLHLRNIDNKLFSMIENDFDQYFQKLQENNLSDTSDASEKFRNLLTFIKEKFTEDFNLLSDTGKGKELALDSSKILDVIASAMTCSISKEPADQLCILKCQHMISLISLKNLKEKICPKCQDKIDYADIKYLSQVTIYSNLIKDSDQITNSQYENDSNDSRDYLIKGKYSTIKSNLWTRIFRRHSN